MSSGRPDFHPSTLLEGKYGSSLLPVLVDSTGQLYIVMTGQGGMVVKLDADGNLYTRISGLDGATVRDVAVDSSGVMLARLKGLYGTTLKDIGVDADGIMISRLQGINAGALKDVALDGSGRILASLVGWYSGSAKDIACDTGGNLITIIQGDYGGTLKTVALDSAGVMKANLTTQDLDYLKVRPVYGGAVLTTFTATNVNNATWTTIKTINGKGAIICGRASYDTGFSAAQQQFRFTVDGTSMASETLEDLYTDNILNSQGNIFFVLRYDPLNNYYVVGIGLGITFETSVTFDAYQSSGAAKALSGAIYYALTP